MSMKNKSDELVANSIMDSINRLSINDKYFIRDKLRCNSDDDLMNVINECVSLPNIKNMMSDDEVEFVANQLKDGGVGIYDSIRQLNENECGNFWSGLKRISDTPLDNSDDILKQAKKLCDSFYSDNHNVISVNNIYGDDISLIVKAAVMADLIGCLALRNDLMMLHQKIAENVIYSKSIDLYKKKKVISNDRSSARKGKTNRHYDKAITIASDTWGIYPNASLAGLSEDIASYLRKDWNDAPVAGTIERWLKDSSLNPDVKPKNRKYELVISKGE